MIVMHLQLLRALDGSALHTEEQVASTLSTNRVYHLNTPGQKFFVGNFTCTGATLWSLTQTLWDSSKGEVIQVLKKLDLNIHACFSLEKAFVILQLQ